MLLREAVQDKHSPRRQKMRSWLMLASLVAWTGAGRRRRGFPFPAGVGRKGDSRFQNARKFGIVPSDVTGGCSLVGERGVRRAGGSTKLRSGPLEGSGHLCLALFGVIPPPSLSLGSSRTGTLFLPSSRLSSSWWRLFTELSRGFSAGHRYCGSKRRHFGMD